MRKIRYLTQKSLNNKTMKKILLFSFFFMVLGISNAQNQNYCTNPTDPLFYPWQWGLKNDGQLLGPLHNFGLGFYPFTDHFGCF